MIAKRLCVKKPWYAQHGRELMGCKSPVRNWESQGDQHAKWITPIDKVRGEGNGGRATDRRKEAGAKTCEATNRNVIQGRVCRGEWAKHHEAVSQKGSQVNDELVQRQFTFLSGEGCRTYLGVGLARKPGPCMRKQLGVGQQSAAVIVPAVAIQRSTGRTKRHRTRKNHP